jgi:hypothetical protein
MNVNTVIEIQNLRKKIDELNQEGCFKNNADYLYLIDKLNAMKESHDALMAYSLSLFSNIRIDIITSPYIEMGTSKMIMNIEDFHLMMHEQSIKTNKDK